MFPEAFEIGVLSIRPMGLAMALGYGLGIALAVLEARRFKVKTGIIIHSFLLFLFFGVAGAKLFYAVFHWEKVSADPAGFISGGLDGSGVLGAVIISIPVVIIYLRLQSQNIWKVLDIITPAWAMIVGFGRLGCFASGCCFGKPTSGPLGVIFDPQSHAYEVFADTPLLPTQLFQSADGFIFVAVTLLVNKYKSFNGATFAVMLGLYSIDRIIIDFYRYYDAGQILFRVGEYGVSATQVLAIGLLFISVMLIQYFRYKHSAHDGIQPAKKGGFRQKEHNVTRNV